MSPARGAPTVLLAVMAGLLVAGCGSTGTSSNSGSTSSPTPSKAALVSSADACTLVTAADASAAVGTTVTNMSSAAGAATTGICLYGTPDFQTTVTVFAQLYPDTTTASGVSPQQIAAALNGAYGLGTAKVVTGIGDKAVEYTLSAATGAGGIVIFVFKSNVVLMIAVAPTSDSTKVEQLARTAVGKL